jgi:hypothetical protein
VKVCTELNHGYVGAGIRRGRNLYEPAGKWVRPARGSATGGERKDVKVTLTGVV